MLVGSISLTATATGEPSPNSSTFVAPPHEPRKFVATPCHAAQFVMADEQSTTMITSCALVLRLKRTRNNPLLRPSASRARSSVFVAPLPEAYFSRFGYSSPVAQSA